MLSRYAVNLIELAGLIALFLDLRARWRSIPAVAPLHYNLRGRPLTYGPKFFLAVPAATMVFAYLLTEFTLTRPDARLPQAGPITVEAFIALLIWSMYVMQRALLDVAGGRRPTLDTARIAGPIALILAATVALAASP
ncbi:MAG: hypothetical protein ABR591_03920 [Candidatus Velthaea sp.]